MDVTITKKFYKNGSDETRSGLFAEYIDFNLKLVTAYNDAP
jgi:hypothetical protein